MAQSSLPGAAKRFKFGILDDNPTYRQLLGMCPTLAVTATLAGAVTMAAATAFVLIMANIVVSLLRKQLKGHLRILVFTMTIATFVTIVDKVLQAYYFEMSQKLGPYVPLIIVNCIIICRCEVCASRQPVGVALADAIGQSLGFLLGLISIAVVREILATGHIFVTDTYPGIQVLPSWWPSWSIMQGPAGAFITLGVLMGIVNLLSMRRKSSRVSVS
ncbi:MAG: electron transport complex subunit RsxE [Planctomycetes bacterium]|nr:electron transport complex subunit RsxE [Planctomycetota bacterium]